MMKNITDFQLAKKRLFCLLYREGGKVVILMRLIAIPSTSSIIFSFYMSFLILSQHFTASYRRFPALYTLCRTSRRSFSKPLSPLNQPIPTEKKNIPKMKSNIEADICLSPNTVIILAGATSVGKSAVSLELCQRIPSEIVIADSVQIYRGLDVGANKPTTEDQALVRHHLVDVAEPSEGWNTADFCRHAVAAIDDIIARGKTPIVVGGSTMWIQWLVHGIPDAPKASEEALTKSPALIDEIERARDWDAAITILRQYDPTRAEKIARNDWYRLRRYLEIGIDLHLRGGGEGVAEGEEKRSLTGERQAVLSRDKYDVRCLFLVEDREELYPIIEERCEQMLSNGLFSETADLVLAQKLRPDDVICKSIGYRQVLEYFTASTAYSSSKEEFEAMLQFLR